jgi:hypothetical protein
MFRRKLNQSNSRLLLNILERLRNGERGIITVNTLFNSEAVLHESCIKLDLFCYKVIFNHINVDLEKGYAPLSLIKSVAMSQSSSIWQEYYYAI